MVVDERDGLRLDIREDGLDGSAQCAGLRRLVPGLGILTLTRKRRASLGYPWCGVVRDTVTEEST